MSYPDLFTYLKSSSKTYRFTKTAIEIVDRVMRNVGEFPLRDIVREVARLYGHDVDYATSFVFRNRFIAVAYTVELLIDSELGSQVESSRFASWLIEHAKLVEERAPRCRTPLSFLEACERAVRQLGDMAEVIAVNAYFYQKPQLVMIFRIDSAAFERDLAEKLADYLFYTFGAVEIEVTCSHVCAEGCREVTVSVRPLDSDERKILVYWEPAAIRLVRKFKACAIEFLVPRTVITEDIVKVLESEFVRPLSLKVIGFNNIRMSINIDFTKLAQIVKPVATQSTSLCAEQMVRFS